MKIKYSFLAMAMAVATSASAQFVSGGGSKGGSRISNAELDPKIHLMADFKLGSVASAGGFGFNLGGTKEIYTISGCTVAWDFLNVEYAAPFSSPSNLDFLSLKTGLRLFSPSFMNDNLRLYTNLAMGYTCVLTKGKGDSQLYYFAKKRIEEGSSVAEKWAEEQGYSGKEIEELWRRLDVYEEAFEEIEPYIPREEEDQAFLNMIGSDKMQAYHGFGLTWGIGVQIKKKFNIGYTLQYETALKTKNHFATFGYTF